MGPEWTHIVGAIAALVAAVAAVLTFFVVAGAAVVAWIQLNQAKSDTKARLLAEKSQSQARLLADEARLVADLAKRWDDPLLFESRLEAAKRSRSQLRYAIEMFYEAKSREYFVLIRVPSIFEDIGLMTRKGTISEDVVRELFAGVVKDAWDRWEPSIDYLRDASKSKLLYEHFQWLNGRM